MTILVGCVLDQIDVCALDLAAQLARSAGTDLVVASVVPQPWSTPSMAKVDAEYARWADDQAARSAAGAQAHLDERAPDLSTSFVAVRGRSVPAALLGEVGRQQADLLVLGSAQADQPNRIKLGSTADRLLHSSPISLALSTCGYVPDGPTIRWVTCAYANTRESDEVLSVTAEYARRVGAGLRVVTFGVRGRTMYPAGVGYEAEELVLSQWVEQSTAALRTALADLADALPADTEQLVATGDSWPDALAAVDWRADEVLVVGSALPGPIARVFIGTSATKIIRNSPVPVIAIPPAAVEELTEGLIESS